MTKRRHGAGVHQYQTIAHRLHGCQSMRSGYRLVAVVVVTAVIFTAALGVWVAVARAVCMGVFMRVCAAAVVFTTAVMGVVVVAAIVLTAAF